jgi:ABC-2 type transport system ATP-binding protein
VFLSTHIVKDVEFSCHQMTLLYSGMQQYTGVPVDFVRRVEGRVYEIVIPFSGLEQFSKDHHVIAIHEDGQDVKVRYIVSEGRPGLPGSAPMKANLEDAYVDFIREQEEEEEHVPAG